MDILQQLLDHGRHSIAGIQLRFDELCRRGCRAIAKTLVTGRNSISCLGLCKFCFPFGCWYGVPYDFAFTSFLPTSPPRQPFRDHFPSPNHFASFFTAMQVHDRELQHHIICNGDSLRPQSGTIPLRKKAKTVMRHEPTRPDGASHHKVKI